ncbi:MAG TPA: polysaccharide pyruvyl transferase family protein [Ureibacillus sp.]|nr:polysaccharide pyruvyl transferase family protein [Ureibacillus sp.]
MKKRIALVGLNNFNNMGDQIIAETMQYLVKKNAEANVDVFFVDISPYDSYCKMYLPFRFKCFNAIRKLENIANALHSNKILYFIQYFSWKIKLYRYFKQQLKNADAIIFSGGGFIKYRTQELNYLVDLVTKIANDKGIPVMMSGMGIEGYSATDIRCQKLKRAINRSCMKIITTRDNLNLLNERYITNKSIKTALVGDPALYIPETYKIKKKSSKIIGLGIIRSDIFIKYGIKFSQKELTELYKNIIRELNERNINWKLFSNGLKSDSEFGLKILKDLGIDTDKYVPIPKSSKELVKIVSEFDAIIGARLHACITAYSLDIPCIGLVWNEKLEYFGKLIAKEKNFINVNQLDAKYIVDSLEKIINETYDLEQRYELKKLTKLYIDDFVSMV